MRTRLSRLRFLAVAVLATLAASFAAAPAAFGVGGTITGTVADSGGPISGISVSAWRYSDDLEAYEPVKTVSSTAGGGYVLSELAAGLYKVQFRDASNAHVGEFYNDIATASVNDPSNTVLDLQDGELIGDIDATLATGGTVKGRVTAEAGGAALAGVTVDAFTYSAELGGVWVGNNTTTTDGAGDYTLAGLPAGTVRLRFSKTGYSPEMHADVKTYDANDIRCTGVAITDGGTVSGLNAALALGSATTGGISGNVTKKGAGAAENVLVEAFFDQGSGSFSAAGFTSTEADGDYVLDGLSAGSYRLRFSTPDGSLLTECYDDVAGGDYANAACAPVPVSAGGVTTDIDAVLTGASEIKGTVTEEGAGTAVPDIKVTAWKWDAGESLWVEARSASTNLAGQYALDRLAEGKYRVFFECQDGTHRSEYWNNVQASDVSAPTVTTIDVAEEQSITGISPQLLMIAPPPVAADAFEDDDSAVQARSVTYDRVEAHSIDTVSDADWLKVYGRAGNTYVFATSGQESLDTVIRVRNEAGVEVDGNDDSGAEYSFSRVQYRPDTDGYFYVQVTARDTGYYTLTVTVSDACAPYTVSNALGSYVDVATIRLTSTDDWSGVKQNFYRIDSGAWVAGDTATVRGVGTHRLDFYATDNAGNAGGTMTVGFVITSSTPVVHKTKVSLGTPVAPKTMKVKKSYNVYGSLKPRHTSGTKPVRIYKYKHVKSKGKWIWKSYGYTTAKAYNYRSYSRYKASIKLTSKGSWRVRAYAPADSKHLATWSAKYDYIKVK